MVRTLLAVVLDSGFDRALGWLRKTDEGCRAFAFVVVLQWKYRREKVVCRAFSTEVVGSQPYDEISRSVQGE